MTETNKADWKFEQLQAEVTDLRARVISYGKMVDLIGTQKPKLAATMRRFVEDQLILERQKGG